MLVYIINKGKLTSFTLPSKIYGSYFIKDEDEFGNERDLINIKEENGRWVAYSNKTVKVLLNNEVVRSAPLINYQFLILQVENTPGYLVLYTSPVTDSSMRWLSVKNDIAFTVGSGNDNAIICRSQLISPQHIKLEYKNKTWLITDLKSQYGTFVNNKKIQDMSRLNHGDVIFVMGLKIIVLGDMLILNNPMESVQYDKRIFPNLVERGKNPAIVSSEEDQNVVLYQESDYFIRSPRFMEVIKNETFHFDAPPNNEEKEDMPLILTLGPMITMGSTSFVMLLVAFMSMQDGNRDFMSVLPTFAISISMMAGTLLWPVLNRNYSKKMEKKRREKVEKRYNEYLAKKEQELLNISANQKTILLSNNLSPSDCYTMIVNKARTLWGRELHQKDFLTVRLGVGRCLLDLNFDYPGEHFKVDDDRLEEKMRVLVEKYKYIEGAPITLSLIEKNILALTGKQEYLKPYADLLILQMAALHSYDDLKIVILSKATKEKDWDYLRLLPHTFSNNKEIRFFSMNSDDGKEVSLYLQRIMAERKNQTQKITNNREELYKTFGTYYMVITDDYKEVKSYPIINDILEMNGNLGFSLLIIKPSLANLPTETKAFIGLDDSNTGGVFESELQQDNQRKFTIEKVDKIDMHYASLRLSNIPLENKEENYVLPKNFGFLEMYNVGRIEQLNPLERWKVNNPINSLAVPIGLSMDGKLFKLDLHEKEEGPHGLIAGMTGSGKSELIITYILSMAINFHPDEVQFVLIDYKGGGLVGAFENKETGVYLPHLAGTITNLEVADINRALASIESELKRRQALFNVARDKLGEGTIDIYKYQKYYREGRLDTPVSHLFIISDEFAELKQQQPEFMDQLISTARIGRSLGVHLILATQKPSGVVNDQIWSNSRFRISLKVQEAQDSNEVIKRPDAAAIKEAGRFYLQVGYDELFAMGQAAWSGAPYIPQDKVYKEVDDDIVFINNIGKSVKTIDTPRNTSIKVEGEQLPNIVKYLDQVIKNEPIKRHQLWLPKLETIIYIDDLKKKYNFQRVPFVIQALIGEYDNPKNQQQGLLTLDLTERGNAIIYSMDEKNTIVNTILYSLITTYSTEEINLYVLDFDSETLKIYSSMPQVGDVIFASETEKVDKLMKLLIAEIEKRKKLFQEYNGSYEFYCKHSGSTIPAFVCLISGYENFKESFEDLDPLFSKIARDGFKYGIYSIVTAITDRSLRLNMRSNFPQIIPLKLSAPIEYNMLLGKKAPLIADTDNRGVALINDEPYEFQTASICPSEKLIPYIKAISTELNKQLKTKAMKVPVLPEVVTLDLLLPFVNNINSIPVGIEEESLDIASYDVTTNFMHLINSDDLGSLANFTNLLIKETRELTDTEILVVDLKKMIKERFDNVIYMEDSENLFQEFDDKINQKQKKNLLVYMIGIEKYIERVPSDKKASLLSYFNGLKEKNVYIFLVGRILDIKALAYEQWFRQLVATDGGIWIGRGLNNSTVHSLTTPLRTLGFPLPPNFGYIIKVGNAIRMKVLEGDSENEQ